VTVSRYKERSDVSLAPRRQERAAAGVGDALNRIPTRERSTVITYN